MQAAQLWAGPRRGAGLGQGGRRLAGSLAPRLAVLSTLPGKRHQIRWYCFVVKLPPVLGGLIFTGRARLQGSATISGCVHTHTHTHILL